MKIKFLLLFTLLSFTALSQTEWAPIGAKWYYSRIEGTMPPNEGYILFESFKDTIIGEKPCRAIRKTYYHSNGADTTSLENEYIYESGGKVSYWRNGRFYTLYDFNANPGDSWTVYGSDNIGDFCGHDTLGTIVVDSISSTIINKQELKVLYTSPGNGSKWYYPEKIVEKIGCLGYFFPWGEGCAIDVPHENSYLRCYEDPVFELFKSNLNRTVNKCDELISYTHSENKKENAIFIFPNPVSEFLNIQMNGVNYHEDYSFCEIINMESKSWIKPIISNHVYVGGLRPGTYFLKLKLKSKPLYYKFIKQ